MNSIVVILIIVFFICFYKQRNMMTNFHMTTESIDNVYHDMKTGDLLLITDENYDIKDIKVIYYNHQDNEIQYITANTGSSGNLIPKPINELIGKTSNKNVLWLQLKEELPYENINELRKTINTFYTNNYSVANNTVFIYDTNKRDFFKCPVYCSKLLHDMGILKFKNPTCFSDPSECIQQYYKNSAFINADQYYHTDNLVKLT